MASVTLEGSPVSVAGNLPKKGDAAPDYRLTGEDLTDIGLANWAGKRKVLNLTARAAAPRSRP